MTAAFLTVLPVFAIIALGWLARGTGRVSEGAGEGLAEYVFNIGLPVLLFRTLATAKLPDVPAWPYWASYFIAVAVTWFIAMTVARRLLGYDAQAAAIAGFGTGQSNAILMGIPLVMSVFGEAGAVPMFLLIAVNLPITMTAATLLVERAEAGESPWAKIARRLATNPILLGIFAGAVYRFTGLPIPEVAETILKMIAASATPCALFSMGVALHRHGFGGDPGMLSLMVALKLIVHPLLTYLMATHVFHLPPVWIGVATAFAACPCGINGYLLAQRYRIAVALSSGAIAFSTLLAIATTTFWIWLVLTP